MLGKVLDSMQVMADVSTGSICGLTARGLNSVGGCFLLI